MDSPAEELTQRLLKKFPGIPSRYAKAQAEDLWATPAFRISSVWLLSAKRSTNRINPYAMELFSARILRRLGIRAVDEQFICSPEQARELSDNYVVKFDREGQGQNLTWNPGAIPVGWCLASKLVIDAVSLDYVEQKILRSHTGKKDELRFKFYVGFDPTPAQVEYIKRAMALDGKKYLTVCTARVFLARRCTPHFGNILTTKKGELISLDHVHAYFESGESLRKLFDFIDRDSKLFNILGAVAGLTEGDIRAAVDEIPKHSACGSTAGLGDYFVKRLQLWKELYARHQYPSPWRRIVDEASVLTRL
jgi:hypothetical protein